MQVQQRSEDLTNLSHAAILDEEMEQWNRSVPLLLSAMKSFAELRHSKPSSALDAQENRNYILSVLDSSLVEVVRVLQLTSPSEEMGALGEYPVSVVCLWGINVVQADTLFPFSGGDKQWSCRGILWWSTSWNISSQVLSSKTAPC